MINLQAYRIKDVKNFMNQMLRTEAFDFFLLSEITIQSKGSYVIDGHIEEGYYSQEELDARGLRVGGLLPYAEYRTLAFDMIKGQRTPNYFKFIFMPPEALISKLLEKTENTIQQQYVLGLVCNVRFQNGELQLITGSSYRIFTTDKSLDEAWDSYIRSLLTKLDIQWDNI
jgi:hypothetical protein